MAGPSSPAICALPSYISPLMLHNEYSAHLTYLFGYCVCYLLTSYCIAHPLARLETLWG